MFKNKSLLWTLVFFLSFTIAQGNPIRNYETYELTKTKYKLEEISKGLNSPWGMTFIDEKNLLITEKNGRLLKVNTQSGEKKIIKHNIKSIGYNGSGQGGLLDVLYNDGYIYFSYSHDYSETKNGKKYKKKSSTAIARGIIQNNEIKNLEVLLEAKPKLRNNKHWGSRIVIKGNYLFASIGERDHGMIAQDPAKHPGSIIRINKNGTLPKDNPRYKNHPKWLPEIYQIGLRNPQGMAISPYNEEVYFAQHGPMGGDHIGKVKYAGNMGWKDIAWGGKEYTGFKIGDVPFKKKYDNPIITWVPSMAIGSINFYKGNVFPEWNGDLLVSATRANMILRLDFENSKIVNEEIILKDKIGRIRDFEIDQQGNIFIIIDDRNSTLWKMSNNKKSD